MTFGRDLCHVGPSKLICETNRWTSPCVVRFLLEGRSEQTMILHLCGSGEYTTFLCFSIGRVDARVPAPSRTWGVGGFLERSLMCWVITGLGWVFHFGTSEIKWRQEDIIALYQFNVRVSWLKIVDKTAWNFKFQKSYFSLYIYLWYIDMDIDIYIDMDSIQWNG